MALLTLAGSLLVGCALRDVLPGPAVVTGAARMAFDAGRSPTTTEGYPLVYTSGPAVPYPVLPVAVWGLRYDLDVVLVSTHPDWVMHEYARIDLPDGFVWLAKDAGMDREQTITAELPDIEAWVPEVPVRRVSGALRVVDTSTATRADLRFGYTNPLGQAVEVRYEGRLPTRPSHPRNGNTMGHSRASVAALLDLFLFRVGGRASLTIDGKPQRLHRLLGLVPEVYLLAQVQGGFAKADFSMRETDNGFRVERPSGDQPWPTAASEAWTVGADGWAERPGPVTTLRYHFVGGELDRAQVVQAGAAEPLVNVAFSPRVPDVRRRWQGVSASRFVVDINGQEGHGTGCFSAEWVDGHVETRLQPLAPRWFADRPLGGTVSYEAGTTTVIIGRYVQELEPSCGQ